MSSAFSVIVEDFSSRLESVSEIVVTATNKTALPKLRVASIHAATLLLAATFEEFVREMARESAVHIVRKAKRVSDLPEKLLDTAWKRTLDGIMYKKHAAQSKKESLEISIKLARPKMEALFAFIEGDLNQDIFDNLIHNENNMRANEINSLFKVSGFKNACVEVCKRAELKNFFGAEDEGQTHGALLAALEDFFNRRNEIAHSLNSASSSGPEQIQRDIDLFRAFSRDLGSTINLTFFNGG